MSGKVPGSHLAVGYWGRDIRCRIINGQTMPSISALQWDQLLAGGLRVRLWQTVHPAFLDNVALAGTIKCSCVKASGEHADRRCFSCHGNDYVPGFVLFGYTTLYVASISPNLTTVGLVLNTVVKPHRWELATGVISGTITTADIQYTRPANVGGFWEARSDFVNKNPSTGSVLTEFSVDAGTTWFPLNQLAVVNPPTGPIRFRVTISRNAPSDSSPAWEILRARFPTVAISPDGRLGPWILILKTVTSTKQDQDPRGIVTESVGNRFWTKPLSFFSCRVPQLGPVGAPIPTANLIRDQAFVEFLDGIQDGSKPKRWSLTNTTYDDPLGYFTRQFFDAREQQEKEFTSLVF